MKRGPTKVRAKRILGAAIDFISDHRRWTRGAQARDSRGKAVDWNDPKSCRVCAQSAIRLCGEGDYDAMQIALDQCNESARDMYESDRVGLVDVNDKRGRKPAIAVMKVAAQAIR